MSPAVLVLDNDRALRDLLVLAVGRAGVPVCAAADAEEAERVLRAGGIGLLLLDLHLGGGRSGHQLARAWEQAGLLPQFLVVTGTPEDPALAELDRMPGFRGVIAKPFSVLELAERARALLLPAAADRPAGREMGASETNAGADAGAPW
ncbi:MAG TPA: response regulator [Planctomycetota bacterium]